MPGGKLNSGGRLARSAKELKEEQAGKKPGKSRIAVKVSRAAKRKKQAPKPARSKRPQRSIFAQARRGGAKKQAAAPDEREAREKVERSKQLIIVTGVSFFMLAIAFVWFLNFRYNIESISGSLRDGREIGSVWQDMNDNIKSQMDSIQTSLDMITADQSTNVLGADISTGTEELSDSDSGLAEAAGTIPSVEDREAQIKEIMEGMIKNQ